MKKVERVAVWLALVLSVGALIAVPRPSPAMAREDSGDIQPRIAVCAVVKIVDELMETDRFKPARSQAEDALRAEKLDPIIAQGRELQEKLEGMGKDDPAVGELRQRLLLLRREADTATREVAQKVEAIVAQQLLECYGLVRASAAAVADDQGFNYVLASGDSEEPTKSDVVMRIVRDFLSRPVLVAPKGVDISEEVRRDLKLQ